MEERVACPVCGESIATTAIRCRFCGSPIGEDNAQGSVNAHAFDRNAEHLQLLKIFHYVVAALAAAMGTFPLIHVAMGLFLVLGPDLFSNEALSSEPPAFIGWFLVAMGSAFVVLGWTFAILIFFTARFLRDRRRYTFIQVVSAFQCLMFPFGTILGVFTLLTLGRASVKPLFGLAPAMKDEPHSAPPV